MSDVGFICYDVVADLIMPGGSGLALVKALMRMLIHLRLFITGRQNPVPFMTHNGLPS